MQILRLLLIDDNPDDRALVVRALQREFPALQVEQIGEEAHLARALDAGPWDLVITDYQLHWSDGLQVLHRVRARQPTCPVVMFTATGSEEIAVAAMKAGLNDYVLKSSKHIARLPTAVRLALEQARRLAAVREAEDRYRSLFDGVPVGLFRATLEGAVLDANPALVAMLGYPDQETLIQDGMAAWFAEPGEFERVLARMCGDSPLRAFQVRLRRRDGATLWGEIHARRGPDGAGTLPYLEGSLQDVTRRKQAEARLSHLAHHDGLTDLPNRVLFMDRLEQALGRARLHGRRVALLYLDLDRFKVINDTLTHEAGDRLLRAIARRLEQSARAGDTVARLGGDEFAILLEDLDSQEGIAALAEPLLRTFDAPVPADGSELFVTVSMGISVYPEDGTDALTLLRNADTAMYRAKARGRNHYLFYTADMNAKAFERLSFETSLRRALEREEFVLHYQPQIELASGRVTGVEALLRWRHPEMGLVLPARFVPLLEETGLIVPVGEWVVRTACRARQGWRCNGDGVDLPVAVNLSLRQFIDPGLEARLYEILAETGMTGGGLQLEITETVMQEPERAGRVLETLHEMGILLAVDDFGVGYSSLNHLKRFPIDTLKIDRSFIHGVPTDLQDGAIVTAVVALARSMRLQVVAEGVETEAQLEFLRELSCDCVQGFLTGAPMTESELLALLQAPATTKGSGAT